MKNSKNKYNNRHTILNCKLLNFQTNHPTVAIMNSIQTEKMSTYLQLSDFYVPFISETEEIRKLKPDPKVLNIFHNYLFIVFQLINRV